MKKIGKLKLNQLSKAELKVKELNNLLGGFDPCGCGCQGTSSNDDNEEANNKYGYDSGGDSCDCMPWYGWLGGRK
jgi:natural product precursor